tara:strand:+ start:558 stop:2291 length:1734 start_codon:yes stop_codon:yes gene_type:complete
MNRKLKPTEFAAIFDRHKSYWDDRRAEMRRLRHAYLMRFWKRAGNYDEELLVETSRAYELVESYVASLFVRDPAVVVKPDIHGHGKPKVSEAVANRWLRRWRDSIEDGLRLSLIYPFAALKLSISRRTNVLDRVEVAAVAPWDIIVDDTVSTWHAQRWCAHRYLIPLDEAKERYGNKKYSERLYERYIEHIDGETAELPTEGGNSGFGTQAEDRFVMIVEVFDLVNNKMYVWSPDWKRDKWLYDGVDLDVGVDDEKIERFNEIPYKTTSGEFRMPIVPLYLSREPDCPMRGYSSLRRVYDQLREVNNIRTFQAQGTRRAARMLVTNRGVLDEEARSKYAQGQDGEVIEVDLSAGQTIADIMQPIPHNPVPAELQRYAQVVDDDFSRGSVMAPFTRGQATQATATEIQALAAYTASEVGRMSRSRDEAITGLAACYLTMIGTLIGDDVDVVRLNDEVTALQGEDTLGDFDLYAEDSGNTPMSEAARKQEIERLTPVLQALGVPNEALLNMLVRTFELPPQLVREAAAAQEAQQAAMVQDPAAMAAGPGAGGGMAPEQLSQARGGPSRVEMALPPGGVV